MRYLILYGAGIGDFVSILPLAQIIKKSDKDAYIVCFNVSDKNKININKGILQLQDYVDDIEYYSSKEIIHSLGFLGKYLFNKFDYSIMVQHEDNNSASLWPYYISRLISKKLAGYESKNRRQIQYDITLPREKDKLFVEVYLKIGRLIGCRHNDVEFPLLNIHKIDTIRNSGIYRKADVVLCVGTGLISMRLDGRRITIDAKSWDYNKWVDLANKFADDGYEVSIIGGAKEREEMSRYNKQLLSEVHDYTGLLSIAESIKMLSHAKLVIGADTGMMHCAAALQIPSITLFGCTTEKQYLPYGPKSKFINKKVDCSPCFGTNRASSCNERKCMNSITVNDVLMMSTSILKGQEF